MLKTLLARMDRWLAVNRSDYYELLQPGVTDAQLDAFECRFSLQLPLAFRQLYRSLAQRAGPDILRPIQMEPLVREALEEITETKDMLDGMIGLDFDDPKWWRRGWIPFLHNGGGSHLCVDVAVEDGGCIPDNSSRSGRTTRIGRSSIQSLEVWLSGLVSSMEDGSLELA